MRALDDLGAGEARRIDALVFDLDDTVLNHGRLTEAAYAALFRLREVGLELVACTGRPAGWCEVIARQWPVTAAIAENGAVAWTTRADGSVVLVDPVEPDARRARRQRVEQIAAEVVRRFPQMAPADDNAARITDLTFDIGERRRVDAATVEAASRFARELGARTFVSSVHMHVTLDGHDKASGFAGWSASRGRDPVTSLRRSGFVGDSANDASAFASFGVTFAVSNIAPFLGRLTVLPHYVAEQPMGAGFAQIAAAIVRARSG